MPTKIEIWRTGGGAYVDYTAWLWGGDRTLFTKTHAINEPQELEFALQDGVASFLIPEAGNRVKLTTTAYGVTFVGYLAQTPIKEPSAQGPIYIYRCRALSEEMRLEWHRAAKFNTLPPFLNKYQGEIISELITILGGGLTTTNVDNGILIPFFRVRPEETFKEVVQRLSDKTNMKFWTANGAAWYKAFNDSAFTPAPNEADPQYKPDDLDAHPMYNPVYNDVLAVGAIEPQAYVREYFLADGFTGKFRLKFALFGAESSKLLEDDFTGTAIDANRWTETDADGILSVATNSLTLNGGATSAISRLTAKEGMEIGGKLELRAGRIRFDAASDCIVGGLFSSDTGALAQCIAGFRCTPSGGQTQIQSIVSGSVTGTTYTTVADKTYQFLVSVDASPSLRRRRQFNSLQNVYGGEDITCDARVTFSVTELSDNESDDPNSVLTHSSTISSIQQFLLYTVIAGPVVLTNSVNAKVNFTLLRKAIEAELLTKKTTDSDYVRRRLGDKADPEATASVVAGTEGHELAFFEDRIPDAKEKIKLVYRAAGQARARVRKDASISSEASKAGDDGVRMAVLPKIQPEPRDAAELEWAIQAFIDDHTSALYEGTWQFNNKSYTIASEPTPGRFITISETSRYPAFSGFVTKVESSFIAKDASADLIEHIATFGVLSSLESIKQQFETPEEALKGSLDTLVDVQSIEFNDVGSTVAADRPEADFTGTVTSTTVGIDTGAAPTSSYEVRKTDSAWGTSSTINLISTPATQTFTVPRSSRDLVVYIKNKDGSGNLPRYPTVIRLVYPLPPPALNSLGPLYKWGAPRIYLGLPADPSDVFGVEVRDSDDSSVLYQYSDILLNVTPDDPALTWRYEP